MHKSLIWLGFDELAKLTRTGRLSQFLQSTNRGISVRKGKVLGKRDGQETEPVMTNEKAGITAAWSIIGRDRLGFLTVSLAEYPRTCDY